MVVALQTVDSPEQIVAITELDKSVQKVNDEKNNEITAPSVTSKPTNLAYASTNGIDDVDMNTGDDKGDFYGDNTSNKKNKLRGFFRKVSRAFNKTAHVDNENNDAILIGSFRIALK